MNKLLTILFISIFFSGFSQGYLKEYLKNHISQTNEGLTPVVIKMKSQVDIKNLKQKLVKDKLSLSERRRVITNTLYQANSKASNFDLYLKDLKAEFPTEINNIKKYWAVNAVSCTVSSVLLNKIVDHPAVDHIQYDFPVQGEKVYASPSNNNRSIGGAEPGLVAINARGLWSLGYTGRNRLAMNIDTGVSVEHPTLNDRFLGHYLPLSQAWLGYETPYPYDVDRSAFHGTHTMGTMIGLDTATADTIGLAFNAFWIATDPIVSDIADIRPMSEYFMAFEWALNPDGDLTTTNDIPDVINNSWGVVNTWWPDCDPIEYDFIEALEAADCAIIFSAGNEGPDDGTAGMPASITKDSLNIFSVGALDAEDVNLTIADFSSRGPSHCDIVTSVGIKPEVSAPGVDIRSASGSDTYKSLSGTSMAGPHVAGAVLLLREAFPDITSNEIKNALYQTAIDLGDVGEDNTYGRGLIDVYEAYLFLSATYTPTPPITNQYDIAINLVEGSEKFTCNLSNQFDVTIKNTGETSLSDFIFRVVLNDDTISETPLNLTLAVDGLYTIPVNLDLVDTTSNIIFEIEKLGIEEFNIYNNYKALIITRLFPNTIPYYEGFEDVNMDLINSNFIVENPDYQNTWELDSTNGLLNSYKSLKMPFSYYYPREGQLDYLQTGSFDIPSTGNTYLYFRHAYTQRFNSKRDSLFIVVSDLCDIMSSGDTIYRKGGAEMKTITSNSSATFYPSDSTEWADNAINLTSYAGQTIYLKFISRNDGSNNLYIDELRVENGLFLNTSTQADQRLKFYPNPTTGELFFENISNGEDLSIYDIRGKRLLQTQISNGKIDISELSNGIYFVRSSSNYVGKFVLQK